MEDYLKAFSPLNFVGEGVRNFVRYLSFGLASVKVGDKKEGEKSGAAAIKTLDGKVCWFDAPDYAAKIWEGLTENDREVVVEIIRSTGWRDVRIDFTNIGEEKKLRVRLVL